MADFGYGISPGNGDCAAKIKEMKKPVSANENFMVYINCDLIYDLKLSLTIKLILRKEKLNQR